jgi:hypothetical protein
MAYEEQLKRVERFLQRIDPPSKDHGSQVEYEDNLWSFFQNAWHLKDWIKNDPAIKTIDIEKIVKNYFCLMLCSDLANRTKHFRLDNNHNRLDAKHTRTDVNLYLGSGVVTNFKYIIEDSSGKEYIAIDLAKEIIKAWNEIIRRNVFPIT